LVKKKRLIYRLLENKAGFYLKQSDAFNVQKKISLVKKKIPISIIVYEQLTKLHEFYIEFSLKSVNISCFM